MDVSKFTENKRILINAYTAYVASTIDVSC